jgi:FdhD protein
VVRTPSGAFCEAGRGVDAASTDFRGAAAVAGFDALVAVGAPSSLAVETAREAGMILCGFTGDSGLNCYSQAARLGL